MGIIDKNKLIEAIFEVQKDFIEDLPAFDVFNKMLEVLLNVTESEYGFIGEILNNGEQDYLKTHAITNISWNKETRTFYEENAPNGLEFKNLKTLFGKVITEKKLLISKDPYTDKRRGGLPPGHPHMGAFCGIPLFDNSKKNMIGMVGIANRPGGYNEDIVVELEALLNSCSQLIKGYRIVTEKNDSFKLIEETAKDLKDKNDQLKEFTYIISHDIRKHSTNLKMLKEIKEKTQDFEELRITEKMIDSTISHLARSVDYISEIVEVTDKPDVHKKNINLFEFTENIINSFKIKLNGFEVKIDIDKAIQINVQRAYLNSVCENLISNSITFKNNNNPKIIIDGKLDQGILILSIQDNGKGIDLKKYGDNIYNIFSTYHGNKESKGIGLFLVRSQIQALQGKIEVESEVNKGTKFIITIPINDE